MRHFRFPWIQSQRDAPTLARSFQRRDARPPAFSPDGTADVVPDGRARSVGNPFTPMAHSAKLPLMSADGDAES